MLALHYYPGNASMVPHILLHGSTRRRPAPSPAGAEVEQAGSDVVDAAGILLGDAVSQVFTDTATCVEGQDVASCPED